MELVSTFLGDHIKIRVSRAHLESTLGQTWSKLLKISEELGFDIKPWKMLFSEDFDLVWPLVNPRLTRGILIILARKRHFERSGAQTSYVMPLYMFSWPHGEKIIFFGFFGVRHANREWTKYGINRHDFNMPTNFDTIIWYFARMRLSMHLISII